MSFLTVNEAIIGLLFFLFVQSIGVLFMQKIAEKKRRQLKQGISTHYRFIRREFRKMRSEFEVVKSVTQDTWSSVNNGSSAKRLRELVAKEQLRIVFEILISKCEFVEESDQLNLLKAQWYRYMRTNNALKDNRDILNIQNDLLRIINQRYENK